VEQWQSGADHNVRLQNGTVQMLDLDATPQEGIIGAFRIVSKSRKAKRLRNATAASPSR
jgi:hypothetical protein